MTGALRLGVDPQRVAADPKGRIKPAQRRCRRGQGREKGRLNFLSSAFQGLLGPAGLPGAVVSRLNSELNKALVSAAVQKRAADFGMEVLPGTPAQFRSMARAEALRWGSIIKSAGVKLD